MKITNKLLAVLLCLLACAACRDSKENYPSAEQLAGVVINEVCGYQDETGDSWIELCNTSDRTIDLKGMKLFLTDDYYYRKCICTVSQKRVGPGEYLVLTAHGGDIDTGISAAASLELFMTSADGTEIDRFVRDADLSRPAAHAADGSFSRLPDGKGGWFATTTATQGSANFGYTNRTGFWLWSTHMKSVPLETLAAKGYGHVILHEQAFKSYPQAEVLARIAEAEALGMTVHIWLQCFYENSTWVSPVDDARKCYDQELFERIISRAEGYLDLGIKAIHLDYIRFGGTAHKHNFPEAGVTGEGAITEFCRQISTRLKAINPRVILSAALMAERDGAYYYGQNPAAMGAYLDILIPMVYRYSESGGGDKTGAWAKSTTDYFVANAGKAEVWAGTQTYRYTSGNAAGLPLEQLRSDCEDFTQSEAAGVFLFRYGLGNFPDVTDLWN